MKCRSARATLWFVLLAFSFLSAPGVGHAASVWTKIETQNFTLIGDARDADIRTAAIRLERFRVTLLALFPQLREAKTSRTNVLVFKDAASFRPFKPKRADGTPDDPVLGFFQAGDDVNYIALSADADSARSYGTIFHEYTHFLVNANFGKTVIPPWLNEGLAEYFQTFQLTTDRTVTVGTPQAVHLRLLNQTQLIPWDEFFKIDNFTLHQRGDHSRTVFYSQAWALMHFLFHNENGINTESISKLFADLRESTTPQTAFQRAFGFDQAAIDYGVRRLVTKTQDQVRPVVLSNDAEPKVGPSVPLSEAMSFVYLGDLLSRLNDQSAAETYILQALKLEPELAPAHAVIGLLRLRQRKFEDARQHLARAVAADQKNFLVHYYYAYLLLREQMDEFGSVTKLPADTATQMCDSLRRAVTLNTDFAEGFKLLALVAMVNGDDLDEALSALKRGLTLEPGNQEYALMTAQIFLRQEKVAEAKFMAEGLLKTADEAHIRSEACDLVLSADAYVKAKAESKALSVNVFPENGKPLILQRRDLTEAEVARIEEERQINNLNRLIERPRVGEVNVVGFVENIGCRDGIIIYRIATNSGVLQLTGNGFDDLRVKVLLEGTRTFTFRCESRFVSELASIVYRPDNARRSGTDGVLLSIAFVPKIFKLKSLEEMSRVRPIIIEGMPATDLGANAQTTAAEQAEMDRQMLETQLKNLEERLRRPEVGEERIIGLPQSMECVGAKLVLGVKVMDESKYFETSVPSKVILRSFTPDAGVLSIGCRASLPSLPAVITFRTASSHGRAELVAIEFVPNSYKLP